MDEPNQSHCISECALAWPPLLTVGSPTPEAGAAEDRLDSVRREDGYLQVKYNGWPLYYYAPDETPGDTLGQGLGDLMFVVSPSGEAITMILPTPVAMDHPPETLTPAALAGEPSPTPLVPTIQAQIPLESPTSTSPPAIGQPTALQEVATLENYAASQFFPATMIVIRDVPVKLLMARLHREHINQFYYRAIRLRQTFRSSRIGSHYRVHTVPIRAVQNTQYWALFRGRFHCRG